MQANPSDPCKAGPAPEPETAGPKTPLSPAAERALAEAAARRAARDCVAGERSKEVDGRGGLEPTRYGDWEIGGRASDF
jgi:hypothetical protein